MDITLNGNPTIESADIEMLAGAVEAMLFSAGSPVPIERLCSILAVTEAELYKARHILEKRYRQTNSGIGIILLEGSLQLCTKQEFAPYVKAVLELKKLPPLSKASLEVLAIIAYNQPVTRVFIEQVRGVDSASIVSSLCDKGLIREDGTLDAPGRPTLFVTTNTFLRCFGLSSLSELPHSSENGLMQMTGEEFTEQQTIDDLLTGSIPETGITDKGVEL
ncbi:MAG: SMC-Scp complex subunit ScpB [Clostridiales bacterium GWF2_38_85]|nr:MAG: SMC-Scp complex subunit ScpB [Clostridiales bacterium GWF2_38_85]HBL83471.1 SMC-Scp complex subunit ScpB [Clostridiales bacterium]